MWNSRYAKTVLQIFAYKSLTPVLCALYFFHKVFIQRSLNFGIQNISFLSSLIFCFKCLEKEEGTLTMITISIGCAAVVMILICIILAKSKFLIRLMSVQILHYDLKYSNCLVSVHFHERAKSRDVQVPS